MPPRPMLRSAVLVALALHLPAARLSADPYAEFRVPEHRLLLWSVALGGNGIGTDQHRLADASRRTSGGATAWGGNVSSRLEAYAESDRAVSSYSASIRLDGDLNHYESGDLRVESVPPSFFDRNEQSSGRATRESLRFGGTHRHYLGGTPFLLAAGATGSFDHLQRWDASDTRQTYVDSLFSSEQITEQSRRFTQRGSFLALSAEAGIGRVRNVTGIYEAQVLVERLRRTGALQSEPSPAAMQRLGELMYARTTYAAVRDRPARDLWAAILAVLRDDGPTDAAPDPVEVQRLMEPFFGAGSSTEAGLPRSPLLRSRGALFSVGVSSRHQRFTWNEHISYFSRVTENGATFESRTELGDDARATGDDVSALAVAEWHRPLGPRWQFGLRGQASAPARSGLSADYNARAAAGCLLTDRWLVNLSAFHAWRDERRTTGATAGDRTRWQAAAGISWYVENATTLELGVEFFDDWIRLDAPAHSVARGSRVSIALTHRLIGRFAAPALPLEPTPPTLGLTP